MKIISEQLAGHIAGEVTTLATCWKLTRRDGTITGFTSHDRDITYLGLIYQASSGFTPSAVANNSELSVDNLDIEGVIDSSSITESDIGAGLYDYAQIEIFMVNYNDTSQGALNLRTGWLGEVQFGRGRFVAEVRGLMQNLAQAIGELYSPSCRAKLGDSRCKVSMAAFTLTGSVTSVISNQIFSDSTRGEDDGWFNGGKITFTSGNNDGLSMEIKEYRNKQIILVLPMPFSVASSDSYSMQAGCDKSFETCAAKFTNAINFRGEPHVPGVDKMLTTAGTM
jgi:uncharacterized phage protein (TIGR02218 family)